VGDLGLSVVHVPVSVGSKPKPKITNVKSDQRVNSIFDCLVFRLNPK